MDDGKFFIRVFDKSQRDEETILREDFDVNKAIGIENNVMPNDRFYDPYITIEFITDDQIFTTVFDNYSMTHYHFIYNHK